MSRPKTLLIITTTFYPHRVVGGVRMTQWCRHLPEFGWKPVILSRFYGHRATAEELAADVHPDVEVRYFDPPIYQHVDTAAYPAAGADPTSPVAAVSRWSAWRRTVKSTIADTVGRLVVPDVSLGFWRSVRNKTLAFVDEIRPDAILTTSPPHSIHDLGRWLTKVRPEIPWVADFRDPYLIDARHKPVGLKALVAPQHRAFEKSVYETASLITHNIPFQARWARMHYPEARKRIQPLTNGCPADLTDGQIPPVPSPEGLRSIRVMGVNDPAQREQLVRVVERLNKERGDLELRFIWKLMGDEDRFAARLGPRFVPTGQLAHRDALAQLLGGDVLVAVLSPERGRVMGISTKLYEYLVCGKPIVVINPTRTDRQLVRRMQGVRALAHPADDELCDALRWGLSDAAMPPREQTERVCRAFSTRNQTQKLAGWLDEVVAAKK